MTRTEIAVLDHEMEAITHRHLYCFEYLEKCVCADAVRFREIETILAQQSFVLTVPLSIPQENTFEKLQRATKRGRKTLNAY